MGLVAALGVQQRRHRRDARQQLRAPCLQRQVAFAIV